MKEVYFEASRFKISCIFLLNVKGLCSRHDQYWQIAYPKFLVALNCIKKEPRILFWLTLESYWNFEVNFLKLCK